MASINIVIFYALIGGLFSLLGGIILLSRKKSAEKLATYATPFAAGALLAAVFLDLLPEGIEVAEPSEVLFATLVGILLFFVAERFLHWFHHHNSRETENTDPGAALIIVGDTLHNLLDGVVIAAAFLVSVPAGIVTTFAVAAHEIPQEIGDFGLLLSKGLKRKTVLIINILSSFATVFGAVVTFYLGSQNQLPIGVLLGISSGFLLYIALSDVIPSIHEHAKKSLFGLRPLMLFVGVVVVGLAIQVAHSFIEDDHGHDDSTSGTIVVCEEKQILLSPQGEVSSLVQSDSGCSSLEECDEVSSGEELPANIPCEIHHDDDDDHDE